MKKKVEIKTFWQLPNIFATNWDSFYKNSFSEDKVKKKIIYYVCMQYNNIQIFDRMPICYFVPYNLAEFHN